MASATFNKDIYKEYDRYYALICDDSEIWSQVCNYAKAEGAKSNIYVDMLSARLSDDYSKEDLLKIAIESGVDGILLDADNTDSMRKLISEAESKGICVVTLMTDCADSKRKSFVQASSFNLGKTYGEQVLSKSGMEKSNILVVMDSSSTDSSQNIVYLGIQDAINSSFKSSNITVAPLLVDSRDLFTTEEIIRGVFMDDTNKVNAIICLDEVSTTSVYQALIDYNKVGEIRLIGSFKSDTILKGIEQGVIEATVAADVNEMGTYGVNAVSEYLDFGYVSEYFSVDSELITSENVGHYLDDGVNE